MPATRLLLHPHDPKIKTLHQTGASPRAVAGSLAKQKVKSRQRASHVETGGAYIAHFTAHGGSRGLLDRTRA